MSFVRRGPGNASKVSGVGGVAAEGRGGGEIVAGEWQVRFYLWRCLLRVPLYWNVYRRLLVFSPLLPVYFSIVLLFHRALDWIPRNLFLVYSFFFLGENWNARRLRCFDSRMRCKRL